MVITGRLNFSQQIHSHGHTISNGFYLIRKSWQTLKADFSVFLQLSQIFHALNCVRMAKITSLSNDESHKQLLIIINYQINQKRHSLKQNIHFWVSHYDSVHEPKINRELA